MSQQPTDPQANDPQAHEPQAHEPQAQADDVRTNAQTEGHDDIANSDRIAELERLVSSQEQRLQEAKEQALRAVAEMENVRRRAAAEVDKAHKFALEKFANDLLTTVDNLERALAIVSQAEQAVAAEQQSFIEGIELTHKGLLATLQRFGVEPVGAVGEVFNPELHQAMAMQPAAEQANNTLLAVLQKGYTLQGRLLRPAMVMVVKNP